MRFSVPLRELDTNLKSPITRSSWHILGMSGIVFIVSCWPLWVIVQGWPTKDYIGNIFFLVPCSIALGLAPALVLGLIIDLFRRGWDRRNFAALLLSSLAVTAWAIVFTLRFSELTH